MTPPGTLHDQVFGSGGTDAAAQQPAAQAARPDPFDQLIVDLVRHVAMNPQVIPQYLRAWASIKSFMGQANAPAPAGPPAGPQAPAGGPENGAPADPPPDMGGLEDALGGDMGGLMDMMGGAEMGDPPPKYRDAAARVRSLSEDELRNVLIRVAGDLDVDPDLAADVLEQVGQVAPMLEPVAGVSADPYLDKLTGYLPDEDAMQQPEPAD